MIIRRKKILRMLKNMKQQKKRTKISSRVEDTVLFDSDKTCCICGESNAIQIHHIDGNHSNNVIDNLAVLCISCHDQVTKKGGVSKSISPGLVRRYRDTWYKTVQTKREKQISNAKTQSFSKRKILDLLAIHEIRKISASLSCMKDEEYEKELNKLFAFTKEYDVEVRLELSGILFNSQSFHTSRLAYLVSCLAIDMLPIVSLVSPSRLKTPTKENYIFLVVSNIGFEMCYLPMYRKYDLDIIDAGAKVLWTVLRFAYLNKLQRLEKEVRKYFSRLKEIAKIKEYNDVFRWLDFMEKDAVTLEPPLPQLPRDVESKISSSVYVK